MKILILGANGMLGHALINEFVADDIFVGDKPEWDVTKTEDLKLKIKDCQPDVVINAAAFTDVDGCETKQDLCNSVNSEAVGQLAIICKELDIILVHYSTDYVFNGKNEAGYKEDDKTDPLNVYGHSKELGEKLLAKNHEKYYLIRTSWLYGRHGKNFVDKIKELSLTQLELKIVNDQFGSPTYTKDLAEATRQILTNKQPFGIYHRTNSGVCNWFEFAEKIKKIKKFKTQILPVSSTEYVRPAKRPTYSKLVNTKLEEMRDWEVALKEYLNLKEL